ncbi:MAG TPA: formate dehydrogenase accessory sulfurtransferase FdhD [Pseudomonadota bacterium]|nr:formate dehydrogenase accessory sulfurtransferase FdhD [Xanthomonadales bacterium]HQW80530.1 formate dehydrogenase accessory sulfurtransferase FdhD [Pseudomonadota bacterium]
MSVIATDGFRRIEMLRVGDDGVHAGSDVVVEEVAIALSYNGTGHAVMMATALDLEDFALGFSLHEGIVAAMEELRFIEALPRDGGVVVELAIPQTRFDSLMQRARHTLGSSACGLCGTAAMQQALRSMPRVAAASFDAAMIADALRQFPSLQSLNALTGGAHAAAWCDAGGVRLIREDVGRHNAFDKLAGALARAGITAQGGYAIVSSRASYELVHKAATAGIGCLVALSAPTSAAIDGATRCGMRLIGFARDGSMNVYTSGSITECEQ